MTDITPHPTKINSPSLAADFPILNQHWPGFADEIEAAVQDKSSPPEDPTHGLRLVDGGRP